jgi:hypothetical protein
MFRPKPVAALAVTAALAVAVAAPVTAASAAMRAGVAREQTIPPVNFTPPASLCQNLAAFAQAAEKSGNQTLANLLGRVLQILGCGGAAI